MPELLAHDVVIYLYQDADAPQRSLRLAECARRYAARRGLGASDFETAKTGNGKPYFPNSPLIHFSISHSGEYWAVAFSGQELGLDIQRHVERDYLPIALRWYHAKEYTAVEKYGRACFFDIWSAKESLVKADGEEGIASFPTFFVVQDGKIAPVCGRWQLKPLPLIDGYSACLCGKELGEIYVE